MWWAEGLLGCEHVTFHSKGEQSYSGRPGGPRVIGVVTRVLIWDEGTVLVRGEPLASQVEGAPTSPGGRGPRRGGRRDESAEAGSPSSPGGEPQEPPDLPKGRETGRRTRRT